jgi:nicotinate-nucleotide pyrophosphorylase (carboxylating)
MFLSKKTLARKINKFLQEDVGQGDITTALIPSDMVIEAEVIAKEDGTIAGIEEGIAFLQSHDFQVKPLVSDGENVKKRKVILRIVGNARTLLSIERTLLNLLSRMSGIATKTRCLIEKTRSAGYKTQVACTRKVAPGLLYFDKKAVMLGGGDTHRLHLDDMILIKDNHLAIIGGISKAVKKARETVSFSKKIEIEVASADQALEAAEAGADIIMLDNFSPHRIREAITLLKKKRLREKVLIEASGGINEQNILEYAASGVDVVSLGEITDSVKALDISLEVTKVKGK